MILLFALNLPSIAIGFWNGVIGFVLLRLSRDGLRRVMPLAGIGEQPQPPSGRVAIVVPVHDEDPESVFRSLRATVASLDATGRADAFDIFLSSDSRDERLSARERALFAAWKSSDRRPSRLHYRRRGDNTRFKAGNIIAHSGEHQGGFAQPRPGLQQLVELADLQPIFGAAQRGDDMLADSAVRAPAFDDLEVVASPNGLAAKEHAPLGTALRMCRILRSISSLLCAVRGTTFSLNFRIAAPQVSVIPRTPSRQPRHNC